MSDGSSRPLVTPVRLTALRWLSAMLGTGVWVYWWTAATRHAPPQVLFFAWLASLVLWGLALFSAWSVPRPTWATAYAVVVIALLTLPRSLSLGEAPYRVTLDEANDAFFGLQMLRQRPWEIVSGASVFFDHPYLTQGLLAWPCLFLEPLFGARLASLLLALASLASTYVLAHRMFGARAAVVAVTVLACSYWHMANSRMAYPYMEPVLMLPLVLHLLLFGVSERNRFVQFLGGALLGASLLVYTPARIVIPISVLWFGHRLLGRKETLRESVVAGAVIALGAAIFLSPYLQAHGMRTVTGRFEIAAIGEQAPLHLIRASGWTSPAAFRALSNQLRAAAGVYVAGGALMAVGDISRPPLLDPVSLTLALVGLAMAASRPRDSNRFLLVAWVAATFVLAQVITDVPTSAYRAAPLFPAVAICAGLAADRIANAARRWLPLAHPYLQIGALISLVAVILPPNLVALRTYLVDRSRDAGTAMVRLLGEGSVTPIYYRVSFVPMGDLLLSWFLAPGRTVRDVPNLMDWLGTEIDAKRDAVFVVDPSVAAASAVIRRCYPAAVTLTAPHQSGADPVLALRVSQYAITVGRDCTLPAQGPGLRARYYSGDNWDGEVQRERIEDWLIRRAGKEGERFGSVEWSGLLRLPVSGEYRFQLLTDGAPGMASIGSQIQLQPQGIGAAQFDRGEHPILLRCQMRKGNLCWLRWAPAGGGDFQAIPPEFLLPPPKEDLFERVSQ